jgi:hypothetical protein
VTLVVVLDLVSDSVQSVGLTVIGSAIFCLLLHSFGREEA